MHKVKRDGREWVTRRGLGVDGEMAVCCPLDILCGKRMIKQPCFSRRVLLTGIMKKNRIHEGS